ncbi:uncharacterized protein M2281_005190 [Mesorhizobium soli]|uniref:DUF418 domain-containing protein n=1 Tax=Pseudaminobacter soli (ex Li et al. 2025) TaxID=1295366 RepID=UPI002474D259|nr:DUF418 domain-containing protein [Mesorhizobium soli]MDH6234572.1 uncharacterized protein [Mesorhizobium soli]
MHDTDRITNIDALRGFALFGILVVNILAFSSVYYGTDILPLGGRSPLDAGLAILISAVFELKFYLLFSFLFGYSVTLQMQSAQKAGTAFLPRMLRRQAGLFLIGVIHAIVLFHGDILTTYAVLGLLLLALRNLSDETKIRFATTLVVVTTALWFVLAFLQWNEPGRDDSGLVMQHAQAALAAYRGTPVSVMIQHLADLQSFLPMLLLLQAPCALAMFLIGFVFGHRKLLENPDCYRPYLSRAALWGLIVGLPGGFVYASATQFARGTSLETAGLALSILTSPFLTAAMIAAMLTMFDSSRIIRWRDYLASAGRMALSNYLMQSTVCALIFHGYGLGLIGQLSLAETLVVAVVVFGAQLLASRWWLRRFSYGPVEWLLRAATIGQWPRWRAGDFSPVTKRGQNDTCTSETGSDRADVAHRARESAGASEYPAIHPRQVCKSDASKQS